MLGRLSRARVLMAGGHDPPPPVVFLLHEDRTARALILQMDTLLRRAPGPIIYKDANRPLLDVGLLMKDHGHHLRYAPMVTAPLTGERLLQWAKAMKPSLVRLDAFAAHELRELPPKLKKWLAALLGAMEKTTR